MRDTALAESAFARWTLIVIAVGFLVLFLALPLLAVFSEALRRGLEPTSPHSTIPIRNRRSGSPC